MTNPAGFVLPTLLFFFLKLKIFCILISVVIIFIFCRANGWGQIVLAANRNGGMLRLIASRHADDDLSLIHI